MTGSSLEIDVDLLLVMSFGLKADLFKLERERPVFCPVFIITPQEEIKEEKEDWRVSPHASPLS